MLSPVASLGVPSPLMAVPAWIVSGGKTKKWSINWLRVFKVSNGFYHQIQLEVSSVNVTLANPSHERLEKRLDEAK